MALMETCTESEASAVEEILHRVASNLSLLMDHDILVESVAAERWEERPAGAGVVHISYKMVFEQGGEEKHGCLLLPLAESITLAGYLMMVPDEEVTENRELSDIDRGTKDAMLELANFVASAVESAFEDGGSDGLEVRSIGCQGVRADIRPALVYSEGEPLVVGRAQARIHEYPEFEALLLVPELMFASA